MFKFALFIILFAGNTEKKRGDTIIKWSGSYRLNYTDFVGKQTLMKDSTASPDTLAVIKCYIKYEVKILSGKQVVHGYAAMDPQLSWMKVKTPEVLKHEQGHFDLAEIYARKFEKTINDTTIGDLHDYITFLTNYYKAIINELKAENDKYDAWTKNTPGRDFYYKWINEQLLPPNRAQIVGLERDTVLQ
jgi:hypothetical protein